MDIGITAKMSGLLFSILSIIFGALIIKYPKMLSWLIGIYFIFTGLFSLILLI